MFVLYVNLGERVLNNFELWFQGKWQKVPSSKSMISVCSYVFICVMIAEFRVVLFLGVRNLLRLFCVQRRDVLRLPGLGRNTQIGFRWELSIVSRHQLFSMILILLDYVVILIFSMVLIFHMPHLCMFVMKIDIGSTL